MMDLDELEHLKDMRNRKPQKDDDMPLIVLFGFVLLIGGLAWLTFIPRPSDICQQQNRQQPYLCTEQE